MDILTAAKASIQLGQKLLVLNPLCVVQPSSGGDKLRLNVSGQTERAEATIMAEDQKGEAGADVLQDDLGVESEDYSETQPLSRFLEGTLDDGRVAGSASDHTINTVAVLDAMGQLGDLLGDTVDAFEVSKPNTRSGDESSTDRDSLDGIRGPKLEGVPKGCTSDVAEYRDTGAGQQALLGTNGGSGRAAMPGVMDKDAYTRAVLWAGEPTVDPG